MFQQFNVDGRFFFLTRARIQPYILVGAGFPWLTIKDSSFLEDGPRFRESSRGVVFTTLVTF